MNKNYSIKWIMLSIILGVINLKYFNNNFLKYISYSQIIFIFMLCLKKDELKAFIYHAIFILSSAAFPVTIESIDGDYVMNTYSKLKIYGPLSLSYIGIFIIFISLLLNKNRKIDFKTTKMNKFLFSTIIISLIPIIIGILGLILDKYNFKKFLSMSIYSFNLIVNLFLINNIFKEEYIKLKKVVISLLIAAPIITLLLKIIGFVGTYGGVEKYAATEVFTYSAVLIVIILYEKNYKLEFLMGIITLYLGRKVYSGKDIIVVLLITFFFFYKLIINLKSKNLILKIRSKRILVVSIPLIILIVFGVINYLKSDSTKDLVFYKFDQFLDLFSIFNLWNIENINKISFSPRVRIISILNTAYQYFLFPIFLILGMGYGGYYKDYLMLYKNMDLTKGAYSQMEIDKDMYFSAHDAIPSIFLTNGFLGVIYVFYWAAIFLRKIKINYFAIISFNWIILIYSFSHHISLFASMCIFLALFDEKKIVLYKERIC